MEPQYQRLVDDLAALGITLHQIVESGAKVYARYEEQWSGDQRVAIVDANPNSTVLYSSLYWRISARVLAA